MDEKEMAIIGLVLAIIGFLHNEGSLDRERLIDYLIEMRAAGAVSKQGAPSADRLNEYLDVLISLLESTQFD